MKILIKSVLGKILIDGDFASLAEALFKSRANLSRANLFGANLSKANLFGADLSGANLSRANLSEANLSRANLFGANLSKADLSRANLSGANLSGANLSKADNAALAIAMTRILPSEGEVIGWKKCAAGVIVKLRVLADAERSHAFGRKCRASAVEVLEVVGAEVGISSYSSTITYRVGNIVKTEKPFCQDFTQECASGIHFFITREEAEAFQI